MFFENLEQAAPTFEAFLETLDRGEDPDSPYSLALSGLTTCSNLEFPMVDLRQLPDLPSLYDQIAENWIANLPAKVSNLARLSKFKLGRKVAVELYLSSIAISLEKRASTVSQVGLPGDHDFSTMEGVHGKSPGSQEAGRGLPTPSMTPSLRSFGSSESVEDQAISRLRRYVVSIKSPDHHQSSQLLSRWPPRPNADPALYLWGAAASTSALGENEDEEDYQKKRNIARRHKRMQNVLDSEKSNAREVVPPEQPFSSGNHSDIAHKTFSSQAMEDIPMTQPDRGAFGSRIAQQTKKKQKQKRRAAGF
jgi:RNA polymerase I-specific transcription initiation factor RRN6